MRARVYIYIKLSVCEIKPESGYVTNSYNITLKWNDVTCWMFQLLQPFSKITRITEFGIDNYRLSVD
jgi:hypothetical protein